ncbi:NAD(P)/FAD-dependent oxidoreductase [Stutzerimonas nitrititolerans]|uniref:NAD(P)/FAD-dependent oxidoreductase n=1 Tax=Stutzerimonas nitrititolerans TaxID=2482751 RepID=UPI0028A1F71B|nr:FAD-dependent oxidoreductase [Stutzerimonas nitrititolerans]
MNQTRNEIVVIGGGAVGVACALWLRRDGHQVVILEPEDIAGQCSYGNASTLAEYACTPIANPSIWANLPGLLFSQDSPFVVRWSRLPQLLPWLLRFMGQCTASRAKTNAERLARLLRQTYSGFEPLLAAAPEARALIRNNGCLYAYTTAQGLRGAQADIALRRTLGVEQEVLDAAGIEALEPAMAGKSVGGVLFPRSCHLRDTQGFLQALAAPMVADGSLRRGRALRLRSASDGVHIDCEDGSTLSADRVVLAAGAWSAQLAATLGERIPLDTERGYHVEFELGRELLTRPTCPVENAFYMTPLANGRLRAAGTVELATLRDPLNPARIRYIEERVRKVLNIDAPVSHRWIGMRPTLPDCVPVIGPSARDPRVIHAFGHQHLGITLAGATGEIVAACVRGQAPDWLGDYSAARFH